MARPVATLFCEGAKALKVTGTGRIINIDDDAKPVQGREIDKMVSLTFGCFFPQKKVFPLPLPPSGDYNDGPAFAAAAVAAAYILIDSCEGGKWIS